MSESLTKERLTIESWTVWVENVFMPEVLRGHSRAAVDIADYFHHKTRTNFTYLSDSEYLIDNFLSFPTQVSKTVADLIFGGSNASTIEAFTKLVLEFQQSELSDDLTGDSIRAVSDWITSHQDSVSKEFLNLVVMCEGQRYYDDLIWIEALSIMRVMYGEQQVIDTLEFWVENLEDRSLSDLLAVMSNWDRVEGYPVDWALNVIETNQ